MEIFKQAVLFLVIGALGALLGLVGTQGVVVGLMVLVFVGFRVWRGDFRMAGLTLAVLVGGVLAIAVGSYAVKAERDARQGRLQELEAELARVTAIHRELEGLRQALEVPDLARAIGHCVALERVDRLSGDAARLCAGAATAHAASVEGDARAPSIEQALRWTAAAKSSPGAP